MATIAENVERIRSRIAQAAKRAGRRADQVTLVAVSKTFPAGAIREAYAAGLQHFGENRVQEWEGKHPLLANLEATWHLVGHLQSNKARRAAGLFHSIDSMDSVELAQRLDRAAGEIIRHPSPEATASGNLAMDPPGGARRKEGKAPRLQALIEVRLAPEETKHGVEENDLPGLAEAVAALPQLELRGLMCIPPFLEQAEQVRPFFRRLRELRDALQVRLGWPLPELSMGMSHDFEVAIEEGATQVRLGTAIFGVRQREPD